MESEKMLTGAVARALGISSESVRRLEAAGKLKADRIEGLRVYDRGQVERLKAQRAAKTNAAA